MMTTFYECVNDRREIPIGKLQVQGRGNQCTPKEVSGVSIWRIRFWLSTKNPAPQPIWLRGRTKYTIKNSNEGQFCQTADGATPDREIAGDIDSATCRNQCPNSEQNEHQHSGSGNAVGIFPLCADANILFADFHLVLSVIQFHKMLN